MVVDIYLPLPPRPASRPRFTCRGRFAVAYTDKPYREWLDAAEALLKQQRMPEGWDTSLPVELEATFQITRPKTSKLLYPKPDIDNYQKALMDAITQAGHIWADDCQVVHVSAGKSFTADADSEGILLRITQLELGDV